MGVDDALIRVARHVVKLTTIEEKVTSPKLNKCANFRLNFGVVKTFGVGIT